MSTAPGAGSLIVARLGIAQTLAWASSYYLPAVLAVPMARDLGLSTATVFAAFSLASVVSALVGPAAGRAIDRHGGRPVLIATSLLFALALVALSAVTGTVSLFAAWALLGVAMGAGLYEGAFSALVRLYGAGARNAITGITLIAGFASTVGWPTSGWLEHAFGWRNACLAWAALHLILGLPLNAALPRLASTSARDDSLKPESQRSDAQSKGGVRNAALLAWAFGAIWFVGTAMATHLPLLLQGAGATATTALAIGALLGPAQVAGRLLEFSVLRNVHPLWSARLASLGQPVGAAALALMGSPAVVAFVVLHGAGHGMLTIAKGTLPLRLFGVAGYGALQGWISLPARVAQAAAPWLFGLALQTLGTSALMLLAGMGLSACLALWLVRRADDVAETISVSTS